MWTPTIQSVEKVNGFVRCIVSFVSDDKERTTFVREFQPSSLNQLKRLVQQEIDDVVARFALADTLVVGDPFDTTITPQSEEVARAKYFKDVSTLSVMLEGIRAGIRKDTDADYLAQLTLVKLEFLPEYEQ